MPAPATSRSRQAKATRPARPARPPGHSARRKAVIPGGAKTAGMSDDAVKKGTGKNWAGWCEVLDKVGAAQWTHKQIAQHLHTQWRCEPWWGQMVTVGYERLRGLRQKHQAADGFQVSASRTMAVSAADAFDAWNDAAARRRWLGDHSPTVRTATRPKSLRILWNDKTAVDVMIYPKARTKCQVTVQHSKLSSARAVAHTRAFWQGALDRLQSQLEG